MPKVYLSPSTQEYNLYYDGSGSEEYYMNLIADYIEPYLTASGIEFSRNSPSMTASGSAADSNRDNYDLHVSIHSNASAETSQGSQQGSDIYYFESSTNGKRFADILQTNFKDIYPDPNNVDTIPNRTFVELRRTNAPAALIEVAYHDNAEDAEWIKANLQPIAEAIARSIAEYLGVPFISPNQTSYGTVNSYDGELNLRRMPTTQSDILAVLPNGTRIPILGKTDGWYSTNYNGTDGYVYAKYVTL